MAGERGGRGRRRARDFGGGGGRRGNCARGPGRLAGGGRYPPKREVRGGGLRVVTP